MVSDNTKQIADSIKNSIKQKGMNYNDLSDLLDVACHVLKNENDTDYAIKITSYVKKSAEWAIQNRIEILQMDALYWRTLKEEAGPLFESFLLYMEKNRAPEKRFYQPRQKTLHVVAEDLQDLEDGLLDFYGLSLPPRVGKSTICIFFLAWIIGKRPDSHNAMSGHSGILADGFHKEVYNLTTSEEYTFAEIFPNAKLESKSAERLELNFNTPDRFKTLTCRGIDGTWTGAIDISSDGYLYVDDMVRDRTESLSPIRLESRYQDYLNVLVDRKNDGTRELMVGTRWNILDLLGRVEEQYKGNSRYRFRKIPALDENGESNFNYEYGLGFSTEYYQNIKSRLDKNEWEAKYQQRPFVREGLLFPENELRKYNGILPDGDYLKAAACDVAWGGGDSLSMPFGNAFGDDGDIFIPEWIFNRGDKTITKPIVVGKCLTHKPNKINFEGNNGGDEYADDIDKILRGKGFKTNITSAKASNQIGKMAKIIQYAPDIKRRFVFLEEDLRTEEYQKAIDELCMIVQIGKNEHEDSADSLVQLLEVIDGFRLGKVEVPKNPFS